MTILVFTCFLDNLNWYENHKKWEKLSKLELSKYLINYWTTIKKIMQNYLKIESEILPSTITYLCENRH